jgi:hypothetical protein
MVPKYYGAKILQCQNTVTPFRNGVSCFRVELQDEWKEVLSQICAKLTTFKFMDKSDDGFLDPLVNAKNLTTLTLKTLPRSETLRQMAENYTCLQYVDLSSTSHNCSENSDIAYLLEKQSQTLTSLKILTCTQNPLPVISKCQNLRKLKLRYFDGDINMDSLGSLSNLKSLHLCLATNGDFGNSIAIAEFQHLNEIEFTFARNLSDNDVCQIAQTYGHQVCNCNCNCNCYCYSFNCSNVVFLRFLQDF